MKPVRTVLLALALLQVSAATAAPSLASASTWDWSQLDPSRGFPAPLPLHLQSFMDVDSAAFIAADKAPDPTMWVMLVAGILLVGLAGRWRFER